ncbi:thioredoxin fold domain-containing protein [Ideonella sp.]|uniref:thioredoxin fold domain-containing protein n=1 Tax=Ideonella sp. TaxID=1929293 RepID=UPI0035AE3A83
MRRSLLPLTALSAALLLAACGRDGGTPPSAAAGPAASAPAAADAYALAATGHGFTTGPMMSAHTVYVFFDTTCPHCAQLWQNLQPLAGSVKVVWMPIGLLRPQSLTQGVAILSAPDPAAAMQQNEQSVLNNGGGITAMGTPDEAVVAKVKANTEIFKRLDADSVPLIIFRHSGSGQAGQHSGAVSAEQLRQMVGL